MKFKLDENIGRRGLDLLRGAGHDVVTVREQGLAGAEDTEIFAAVVSEGRALITLDYDFAQVIRYPPENSAGIVVLDLGARASLQSLIDRLDALVANLQAHPLAGRLWIIEPGRIRIHLRRTEENDAT